MLTYIKSRSAILQQHHSLRIVGHLISTQVVDDLRQFVLSSVNVREAVVNVLNSVHLLHEGTPTEAALLLLAQSAAAVLGHGVSEGSHGD